MDTIHNYKILTISHKHTPLPVLGRFVLDTQVSLQDQLSDVQKRFGMQEIFYLATCNRILFCFVQNAPIDEAWVGNFLAQVYPQVEPEHVQTAQSTAQLHEGREAITHLFAVASSIDSLVVGEREILRQLRTAYEEQSAWNTTGDSLRLLMRFVVEAAKKVYSNTGIGEKPVSVVSLAMNQLLALNPPKTSRILLLGAGQTNQLVSKFLIKYGLTQVTVFNRSLPRAQSLAQQLGNSAKAYTLAELGDYREGFDIIIACTGATEPILTSEIYTALLPESDTSNKILVDLSIPYNISAEVVEGFNTHYIEIEQLKNISQTNLAFRETEVEKARELLEIEVDTFETSFRTRQLEKALSGIPTEIKAVKSHALNQVFKTEVDSLDASSRAILEKVLNYMERRCIAIPLQTAREQLIKPKF